ncbi:nuclear transport factor 2-like protein [Microbulbifer celer]|uniref:SnoaL-like domain-containing protein n=1 Tax=Microbulbifer celer TaxID=435905 RepID=A0ABW3U892_9GAMM|nr:nuclear transport factor 2 family protein [Microbulbifer celer]UFN58231.1 nuclear transport factor 2 family protein [Microbulbifer celer]
MIEIIRSKDCGNSPKNQFVEKVVVALESGDFEFLDGVLSEGAVWELANSSVTEGDGLRAHIQSCGEGVALVKVDHVISHGKSGSANGYIQDRKGKVLHFCHFIEFTSAKCVKINRVCSYGKC